MIPTVPIERFYRTICLIERVTQLALEVNTLADTLDVDDANECQHLIQAAFGLKLANEHLEKAQRAVQSHCQAELIDAQMRSSIELINRAPERMRREKGERG
jgi:hypothetical protein